MATRRWFPEYGKPLEAEGGLRARSRRGAIGESWWAKRFIAVLESHDVGGRLERGRRYARKGQVLDVDVTKGRVTARVQGSERRPYDVVIEIGVVPEAGWQKVAAAIAEQAGLAARLLAGELPPEIEPLFAGLGLPLLPAGKKDLVTSCSCPDVSNPCKHIAAVLYVLAEHLDEDPFLVLRWRGGERERIVAEVGASFGEGGGPGATTGEPISSLPLVGFWGAPTEVLLLPRSARGRPGSGVAALGPLGIEAGGRDLAEVLAEAVHAIAEASGNVDEGP